MEHIVVIKPSSGFQSFKLREVYRYKDLLYFLVVRGIKAKYAQSILGVGWAVIQPLFLTLIFTIVFGNLVKVDSEGVPYVLFSLCAMVPWTYFSGTLSETSGVMVANTNMVSKVYFPRLVLPLSAALSKLLDLGIGVMVLILFLIFYRTLPGMSILVLPYLFVLLIVTSFGLGLVLCAMAVQYRDVRHIVPFLVQVLLYATPVVYPASVLPQAYRPLYALNPMVGVIEGFRSCILGTGPMPWMEIGIGTAVAAALLLGGLYYFQKMERTFADVV